MSHSLLRPALCVAALLAATNPAYVRAQSLPALGNPSAPAPSPDFQQVLQRLDVQEAEIHQLREQLGKRSLASESDRSAWDGASSSGPAPTGDDVSVSFLELQDRISSLEQRVDKSSSQIPAATDMPEVGNNVTCDPGSDLKMTASWKNGVQFATANKEFRMHVGGRVQWDISAFDNDPNLLVSPSVGGIGPQPDSTQFRRARLRADGTMYDVFDWVAEYDFANTLATAAPSSGQPVATVPGLTELTITWTQLPIVGNFRAGNQREPMGMEHLISDLNLDFLERLYLRDTLWGPFNNGYTPGVTFFDWSENQDATWAVGLYANQSDSFGYAIGNETATTGRLTFLPYYDAASNGAYLWHIGASGSIRQPDQGLVRIRTRGDIRSGPPGVLNPIYADTGTMDASQQDIAGVESAVVWGPFTLEAEYDGTWVQDAVTTSPTLIDRGTPFFHGGYVQLLWCLTGEHSVYNRHLGVFEGIVPFENAYCVSTCDGVRQGSGAWQLGVRYNTIDLNDNGVNGGVLNSFTCGINWYWTPNAKVQFNYDLTHRSQVDTVEPGYINSFGTRFAYYF